MLYKKKEKLNQFFVTLKKVLFTYTYVCKDNPKFVAIKVISIIDCEGHLEEFMDDTELFKKIEEDSLINNNIILSACTGQSHIIAVTGMTF